MGVPIIHQGWENVSQTVEGLSFTYICIRVRIAKLMGQHRKDHLEVCFIVVTIVDPLY